MVCTVPCRCTPHHNFEQSRLQTGGRGGKSGKVAGTVLFLSQIHPRSLAFPPSLLIYSSLSTSGHHLNSMRLLIAHTTSSALVNPGKIIVEGKGNCSAGKSLQETLYMSVWSSLLHSTHQFFFCSSRQ